MAVQFRYLVAETTFRVVLGYEVNVVALRVVNDLVEPYNVRMWQSFEHFELLFYTIVGSTALSKWFLKEAPAIHFLYGEVAIFQHVFA